ncbi:MAG: NAD(P)/FAD-dependent oxidoreductase [Nitrospirae bacterium]|nr:NAD(P)/FAD-dependent oxidoreductase [Nitrospirota bacterium]
MRYDVVIIGAGPAGNWAAGRLAAAGLAVAVVEEHRVIGEPRFCTGILGARGFDEFDLPGQAVQRALSSATIYSPLGRSVRISRETPQAYLMDRAVFDQLLAQRAAKSGADYWLGWRAEAIAIDPHDARVTIRDHAGSVTLRADACLLATGSSHRLHAMTGLAAPTEFLDCVQAEFAAGAWPEIELFVGRSVAPGSFGWAVPVDERRVRVGVCVVGAALPYFNRLLASPALAERVGGPLTPLRKRRVPVAPAARSVADRAMLVGDAAGQVKPLTGGGIYYSLRCADLAADALIEGASTGDFSRRGLLGYERAWRRAIGRDLAFGRYARRLLAWSGDRQIDALVGLCQRDEMQALIARSADFDAHHRLFVELFRSPAFWGVLSRGLSGRRRRAPAPAWAAGAGEGFDREGAVVTAPSDSLAAL